MMTNLFLGILVGFSQLASAAGAFDGLNMEGVYSLPAPQLEQMFFAENRDTCDLLISSVSLGSEDPAQLSPAQLCAVQDYSNGGYQVNRKLWETDPSGSALTGYEWAYVRVLDSALAKIKSEPVTTVYRGTSAKDVKFTHKGQIVRLKGYTSTSPNREVAEGFIKDRLMIIKVSSGKNIKIYSNAGMEDEFLLARSTRVRFEGSEFKMLDLFTEEGPEKRRVEIVYLTEVD